VTERTVRAVARKLASEFYTQSAGCLFGDAPEDRDRSARYRATYPTLEHYLKGYQVLPNGKIKIDQPGWIYFISLARARLVQMLQDPNLTPHLKEAIYASLLEEHEKSTSPAAQEVLQRRLNNGVSFGS